jgi:heme exporter protein CcmD
MTWPGNAVMGDYAFYVWGSFGLMVMALGGEVLLLLRRRRAQRDNLNATRARGSRQVQR